MLVNICFSFRVLEVVYSHKFRAENGCEAGRFRAFAGGNCEMLFAGGSCLDCRRVP